MDTDTDTAEEGHQEVLIVGAGAPDNALLHLGICPGEPLGDQVPDCGHALLPAPGQSLQSDSRCSDIKNLNIPLLYPAHTTLSRVLTVRVSWRVSPARLDKSVEASKLA